jgi:RHS repeat-associated protein
LTDESIASSPDGINGAIHYVYDPVGNRLSRTSTVTPVPSAAYAYDPNDRLATDIYDANGNTINSGTANYTYDFQNRLKTQNGSAVSIIYDGDGNRVARTVAGIATRYLVDDRNLTGYAQVLEEIQSGSVQRVFTYGPKRITQNQAGGTSFYGYDGHGSVRLLTDTTGAITDRYDYDAFGGAVASPGGTINQYRYSGEALDQDLALYYLRARYLKTDTNRFWSSDPFESTNFDPLSAHRYIYANGDPVNKSDPAGKQALAVTAVTVALLNQLPIPNLLPGSGIRSLTRSREDGDEECRQRVDVPKVYMPFSVIPNIAFHISIAQTLEMKPRVLTRTTNELLKFVNRFMACGFFRKTTPDGSCDEYPFASTYEGGGNSSTLEVPEHENDVQGGILGNFYRRERIENRCKFEVCVAP